MVESDLETTFDYTEWNLVIDMRKRFKQILKTEESYEAM